MSSGSVGEIEVGRGRCGPARGGRQRVLEEKTRKLDLEGVDLVWEGYAVPGRGNSVKRIEEQCGR